MWLSIIMTRSVAHDLLYMNYQQRRSAYLLQRADYRQKKDYVDKLTELADDLLTRAAVPIDRHHHITTIHVYSSSSSTSS